jgi:acetylornithine/N-succinyldiaminopimelate aminotransferase
LQPLAFSPQPPESNLKEGIIVNATDVIALEQEYVLQTYKRPEFVLVRGEGARVFDSEGQAYLDGVSGIAVNALGYRDAEVLATIQSAAEGLIHVSNLYHTEPHVLLARSLVERSFADRVFFCNSGTEAVEGALKFARKYARQGPPGAEGKTQIVAFTNSFHGRTMGALSTTATEKYRAPFEPLVPGVSFVSFNDSAGAEEAITEDVCAVIVEPVQGEGGVNLATADFLERVRAACDRAGALLIFDEIQCGLGRTGHLWAHDAYGVSPDLMTLAKPLAGGLPMGVVLMTQAVADVMGPGDHGSTFAAGPLVCQVAQVVLNRVSAPGFLASVREKGRYLGGRLAALVKSQPLAREARGVGLIWGVECEVEAASIVEAGYRQGRILVCSAGPNVVRLLSPLTINQAELDELVDRLEAAFEAANEQISK